MVILIRLLIFHLDNLVSFTDGLDPVDLRNGPVQTKGQGVNRYLWLQPRN